VLGPLLLLGFLELVLRLAGFGHPTSFLIPWKIDGKSVLVENRAFGFSFFPPAIARSASPVVMRAPKPPGVRRIFLFGESAALGDPRPAFGVGRYLETLLRERYPGTNFEVICVAMTAINSHAILPIARECAAYEGDLWILYLGNNEFVGPFGASTVFGRQAPPCNLVRLYLTFQRTRLGQAFAALARRVSKGEAPNKWGGMKMFLDQQIAAGDPRKRQVYENFEANLNSILDAAASAGVPVILSSMASNLKECPPFASLPPPDLAASRIAEWTNLLHTGITLELQGRFADALLDYQAAARISPQNAELQFRLGTCLLMVTNTAEARQCFVRARDLDALPFRADSQINQIIAATAARRAQQRVNFFDAEETLAGADKLTDQDCFYEHVHLNFSGNYRLARALSEPVSSLLGLGFETGPANAWPNAAKCDQRLGLSDWNRQAILEEMRNRLSEPPFSNQLGNEGRLSRFDRHINEIRARTRSDSPSETRRMYQEAVRLHPEDQWLHYNYAEYLGKVGDLAQATEEMRAVCRLVPEHYSAYYQLGRLQVRQKKWVEARQSLESALKLRPEYTDIYLELSRVLMNEGDAERALSYCDLAQRRQADDGRLHVLKAKILRNLKRRDESLASLREATRIEPQLWEGHDLLGAELGLDGNFAAAQAEFETVVRLRPNYAEGHLNLGIALVRQRQFAEALREFRETLRLDPQNQRAQEFLDSIPELHQPPP